MVLGAGQMARARLLGTEHAERRSGCLFGVVELLDRHGAHEVAHGLEPRPERWRAAAVPATSLPDGESERSGVFGDRAGQCALADPGLAGDENERAPRGAGIDNGGLETCERSLTSDQCCGAHSLRIR